MKILIIGGGGREHALAWKLSLPGTHELHCLPGNAGIETLAKSHPGDAEKLEDLLKVVEEIRPDLTLIGPEDPLCRGAADELNSRGYKVFGPSKMAARIEGSKVFAKEFMARHNIPTAPFEILETPEDAYKYVESSELPLVVKADGLAKGKGAYVCHSRGEARGAVREIMEERVFGSAGEKVVIEKWLSGPETTFKVFTDGTSIAPMVPSQDYKRIFDGNKGPNTGGMGCYSPVPVVSRNLQEQIMQRIIEPAIKGLREERYPYKGVLYGGLILTSEGPHVLEFNCRFGDPESQVVLPRLETDLSEILCAAVEERLEEIELAWSHRYAVCVVASSAGYPGSYEKGKPIRGLEDINSETVIAFHAGTTRRDDSLVTNGGRVVGITGLGDTFRQARQQAYQALERIHFEGIHFRRDIAAHLVG